MATTDEKADTAVAEKVSSGLRRLQDLTEDQRRALLEEVRGSLSADDLELTPQDTEVVLAVARGDLAPDALLDLAPRPPEK